MDFESTFFDLYDVELLVNDFFIIAILFAIFVKNN